MGSGSMGVGFQGLGVYGFRMVRVWPRPPPQSSNTNDPNHNY